MMPSWCCILDHSIFFHLLLQVDLCIFGLIVRVDDIELFHSRVIADYMQSLIVRLIHRHRFLCFEKHMWII